MKQKKDGIYNRFIKRILDIFISLISLIILSPLLIILTTACAIAMRGNPFFGQKRPGKIDKKTGKEKIFTIYKFRSMTNKKDADGNLLPDNKRLTKFGKMLRKTSLDELLELWNILKGDMSFIGPRPLLVEYLPYYTDKESHRHDIRPGLTGLAQVNGRNEVKWGKRLDYDVEYVNNISFLLDVHIILKSIKIVLSGSGIAEDTTAAEGNLAKERSANI